MTARTLLTKLSGFNVHVHLPPKLGYIPNSYQNYYKLNLKQAHVVHLYNKEKYVMLGIIHYVLWHYERIHSGKCVYCVCVMVESIVSAKYNRSTRVPSGKAGGGRGTLTWSHILLNYFTPLLANII